MLRSVAILFGIVLLITGVLGFIPTFTEQGELFGIFRVNFEHNVLHLSAGLLGILCGLASKFAARTYFIIAGIIFALLTIFGLMEKDDMLFEMIAINTADNILHAAIAGIFLLIGFSSREY